MFHAFKSNPGFGFIQVGMEFLYPNGVPEGAIQITDEQHADFLNKQAAGQHQGFDIVNGQFVYSPPPPPTLEEQQAMIQKMLVNAVQSHMDSKAVARGYDNLLSVVTYAEEPANPIFQQEGIAFRAWRSLVWAYCYDQVALVKAGTRPAPTVNELIAELPVL